MAKFIFRAFLPLPPSRHRCFDQIDWTGSERPPQAVASVPLLLSGSDRTFRGLPLKVVWGLTLLSLLPEGLGSGLAPARAITCGLGEHRAEGNAGGLRERRVLPRGSHSGGGCPSAQTRPAPTARRWKSPGGPTPLGGLPARPTAASQTEAPTRRSASYPWAQHGWGWPGRHPDTRTGRQCGLWPPPAGPQPGTWRQLRVQEPAPSPHHLTPGPVCCLLQAGHTDGPRRPPGAPACREGCRREDQAGRRDAAPPRVLLSLAPSPAGDGCPPACGWVDGGLGGSACQTRPAVAVLSPGRPCGPRGVLQGSQHRSGGWTRGDSPQAARRQGASPSSRAQLAWKGAVGTRAPWLTPERLG